MCRVGLAGSLLLRACEKHLVLKQAVALYDYADVFGALRKSLGDRLGLQCGGSCTYQEKNDRGKELYTTVRASAKSVKSAAISSLTG